MEQNGKYNLINFGFNPWSPYWKRNQTIFYLLSKESFINKALFINTEVWLSNIFNIYNEFKPPKIYNWKAIFPRKINRNSYYYTPHYLPFSRRVNAIRKINKKTILSVFNKYIDNKVILIINNFDNNAKWMIDFFKKYASIIIFDISDDVSEFTNDVNLKKKVLALEKVYCKEADIVFTVNDFLKKRVKKYNSNTFTIPNATNIFTFFNTKAKKINHPIEKIKHPIIGYMGWINKLRLDLELIYNVILNNPQFNFVFIGPKTEKNIFSAKIEKLANFYYFPAVEYKYLPNIIDDFDVCILPNKLNEHTKGNDPIKLYDYLALGKPIVSTPTMGTEKFIDNIIIANNAKGFSDAIKKALSQDDDTLRIRNIKLSKENSWQIRIENIKTIIKPFLVANE